jgi:ArsR family transcriptional regulator, arsenate/arsenite/antimonite-responsive transcriptional repressor / arsenate reductase (thioredoxin)
MGPISACAQQPPAVFRLAAHALRWRLLNELARSDHRVRELTDSLGEPQPLVSYHLRQLRAGGLVSMRRSSFDARDTYYSLDLGRCGELLGDGVAALHPALRPAPATRAEPRRRGRTPRVLFLCTGNSARSQIAEALLDDLSCGAVPAFSAGSHPKELHPNAVRALRARGLDVTERRSKHLDTFRRRRFDWVISLCDRVRKVCPEFPGEPQTIHWSIPDPAAKPGSDDETYPAFERTAAELETRIHYLLATIDAHTTEEVSRP